MNKVNSLSLFLGLSRPYFLMTGILGSKGYWCYDGKGFFIKSPF